VFLDGRCWRCGVEMTAAQRQHRPHFRFAAGMFGLGPNRGHVGRVRVLKSVRVGMGDQDMAPRLCAATMLTLIRGGYPGGVIPGADFAPLVALLLLNMCIDDVIAVAAELVVRGTNPLSGVDLRSGIAAMTVDKLPDLDVARVTGVLQGGGRPADQLSPVCKSLIEDLRTLP
jgi:hypothetical protein